MRSAEKKKKILEGTRDLLVIQGGPHLTMRKVAERVGISLGNLQYHYATREILLEALLNDFLDDYEGAMLHLSEKHSGNTQKDLERLFMSLLTDPGLEDCAIIFKELWAESQHHEEMRVAMQAYYKRLSSFYMDFLTEVSGGARNTSEIRDAVSVIVPLLEGMCITGNVAHATDKKMAQSWARIIAGILNGKI